MDAHGENDNFIGAFTRFQKRDGKPSGGRGGPLKRKEQRKGATA